MKIKQGGASEVLPIVTEQGLGEYRPLLLVIIVSPTLPCIVANTD